MMVRLVSPQVCTCLLCMSHYPALLHLDREIREAQRGTELLIPKKRFQRLAREYAERVAPDGMKDIRFQPGGLEALQVQSA